MSVSISNLNRALWAVADDGADFGSLTLWATVETAVALFEASKPRFLGRDEYDGWLDVHRRLLGLRDGDFAQVTVNGVPLFVDTDVEDGTVAIRDKRDGRLLGVAVVVEGE